MKRSCIYLKYKQERLSARLLRKLKKRDLSSKKSKKVPEATIKVNPKVQQSVRVSLPIKHFINVQNKRCTLINNSILLQNMNDAVKYKVPKLVIRMTSADSKNITKQLRQVRRIRNKSSIEQKKTNELNSTISNNHILKELSVVITKVDLNDILNEIKSSSKGDTNKGNDQQTQCSESSEFLQSNIIIPVDSPNGEEDYRTCCTIAEAKKAFNIIQVSKDTQTEPIDIITRVQPEIIEKLQQYGVLQKLEELFDQNSKNQLKSAAESEIIDLDLYIDPDQLKQERLNMALSHSDANKTILKALQSQMIKSTTDQIVAVSLPTRAGTPVPFVNSNVANAPARVCSTDKGFVSASNAIPASMHPSAATTSSNSQSTTPPSPKRIIDSNQLAKDFSTEEYDGNDKIINNVSKISQGNDRINEVNLNTLAEIANSLKKLILPPVVEALKKDYQLQTNLQAQRQLKKAQELQSHKQITQPSQLLPPKSQSPQSLPSQLQPPKSQPPHTLPPQLKSHRSQPPPLLQMQPPYPKPAHQQLHSQLTQLHLSMSQPLSSQPPQTRLPLQQSPPSQPLQPQTTQQQPQQMKPTYPQPAQLQLSRSQPSKWQPLQTQLPLQQSPPSQLLQPQPTQQQLQQMKPPYPQPAHQQPHPQLTQVQLSMSQPPPSQPLQPTPAQQQRQQMQPHFLHPTQLQLSRSQPSKSQPLQTQLPLQQPPPSQPVQSQPAQQQLQQMQPHFLQPTQMQLSQSEISQTLLPLQQPPPSQPPQIQPPQRQLLRQPPYPQPTQMPNSQLPSSYGAQQWQQQLYYDQQQQDSQYAPRQHNNYPRMTMKAKRGGFYLHPGDPRKPPQHGFAARPSSGYSRMMSYEDHFRNAQNAPYPNYFPQQTHWNNPNHYW